MTLLIVYKVNMFKLRARTKRKISTEKGIHFQEESDFSNSISETTLKHNGSILEK